MTTLWGLRGSRLRVTVRIANLVAFTWLIAMIAGNAEAQSFSCPIGKEAACLDYGANVCSSFAKCVDHDAQCFASYQCNYEGFTCTSNLTELASKYDKLVGDYNKLVRDGRALSEDYDDLLEKSRQLSNEHVDLKARVENLQNCILLADTIEDAQACSL